MTTGDTPIVRRHKVDRKGPAVVWLVVIVCLVIYWYQRH
jgi:hypothetical protein